MVTWAVPVFSPDVADTRPVPPAAGYGIAAFPPDHFMNSCLSAHQAVHLSCPAVVPEYNGLRVVWQ
ncbi:MAG: hypothetical protein OXC82_05010 [Rhodobacteraceae bacterium]|nr:hypothetical protein [Paracoccaceae bacterium]MCY4249781.1 hypothetical protein [Paracoccaceae bacterium]MCY4308590.1 hypothetical protein [Paracoccaceae bacterium]